MDTQAVSISEALSTDATDMGLVVTVLPLVQNEGPGCRKSLPTSHTSKGALQAVCEGVPLQLIGRLESLGTGSTTVRPLPRVNAAVLGQVGWSFELLPTQLTVMRALFSVHKGMALVVRMALKGGLKGEGEAGQKATHADTHTKMHTLSRCHRNHLQDRQQHYLQYWFFGI